MEALWNAIKALSPWQIVVLAVALFGSAAAVYFVYADANAADGAELAENQQLIPVNYGDILNRVSTNGNVTFPEREILTFGLKGTVGQLLVEEGQDVTPGQELARLDTPTIAALEEAVAQARVDLLNAEEALAELREPPSAVTEALDRAAAAEKIAAARFQVQQARDDLEDVLDPELPTLMEVAAQEERIAATELQISRLQEEREDLLDPVLPTDREVKAQEELIADARVKLQEAVDHKEELLTRNLDPDYEKNLAEALQRQADAEKELAAIRESLDDLAPSERELAEAAQARLQAQVALDEANQALDQFIETQGATLTTRRNEKRELTATLEAAQSTLDELRASRDRGARGLDNNIRRWEAYVASVAADLAEVRFGIVSQVEELEAALVIAETALAEAEDRLAELAAGPDALERASLEARALAVIANQEVIGRNLAELERPEVDPLELARREARIVLAEATLNQAVADLAELIEDRQGVPDSLELALNSHQLELARATLAQQREDLAQLLEDRAARPDPLELALKEQQIVLAEATLAQAEDDMAQLLADQQAPVDPLELALAEQKAAAARTRLTTAQTELDGAAITAPIGGYVAELKVAAGDVVEARTEILEIVDPAIVEVDGIVDEIDVPLIQVGTAAEVSLDALPGLTITGVVTEIAEDAQNQQGVVSYPIRIRMEVPPSVQPRAGLSAVANIVLREERNVLLVPQQALYGSFDRPVVRVMTGLGITERPVTLGSSDDFWVAVTEGLAEGDRVVLEAADVASESGFGSIRRATGGGRPRSGGPR